MEKFEFQIVTPADEIPVSFDELLMRKFYVFENNPEFPPLREMFSYSAGLPGYIFAICMGGTARTKINLKEYLIDKNTVISIPPNFIVEFIEQSSDYRIKFLFFSFDFVSDLKIPSAKMPKMVGDNPCIKVADEQLTVLLNLYSSIASIFHNVCHRFRDEIAKNIISTLRYEIAAIYLESEMIESDNSSRHQEIFSKFVKLVLHYNKQERRVSFYADKLCISPKYLSEVVKDKTRKTPLEWINESVIILSKTLLKSTDMSIIQISEELNFPNSSFFCRYFKQHTGISPLKYRET